MGNGKTQVEQGRGAAAKQVATLDDLRNVILSSKSLHQNSGLCQKQKRESIFGRGYERYIGL